jgi:repressor LexA
MFCFIDSACVVCYHSFKEVIDMEGLTRRQKDVFDYLKKYINDNGYAPCVRDICDALDLKSTSTAHAHLTKLESKGYISRDPAKPRTIMILDGSTVKERMVPVPVVGRVAAGTPITAVENIDEYLSLPYSLLGSDDVFILNVAGDSMINAGIFNHDKIIAQKQDYAQNGDIVVALIEDEATVKRFFVENGRVRLQPENDNYDPIYTKQLDILGKVIGVLRMFK